MWALVKTKYYVQQIDEQIMVIVYQLTGYRLNRNG